MRRTDDDSLTLTCRGCGAAVALDRNGRLLPGLRPFVEVHRACASADEQDVDMRTAFARSA